MASMKIPSGLEFKPEIVTYDKEMLKSVLESRLDRTPTEEEFSEAWERIGKDREELAIIARDMDVPSDYLIFGYASVLEFADGSKTPEYAAVAEYRDDILKDYLFSVCFKPNFYLIKSNKDSIRIGDTDFTENDFQGLVVKVLTWVAANGGLGANGESAQSTLWGVQGLCKKCGGTLGLFRKCKSCGAKN